jgi:hypothetical protein
MVFLICVVFAAFARFGGKDGETRGRARGIMKIE